MLSVLKWGSIIIVNIATCRIYSHATYFFRLMIHTGSDEEETTERLFILAPFSFLPSYHTPSTYRRQSIWKFAFIEFWFDRFPLEE